MTELVIEILAYLGIAALLGLLLGYLIWGWGNRGRIAAARAEGIASARTSVDGSSALRGQLEDRNSEIERLEREVATLRHRLERQQPVSEPNSSAAAAASSAEVPATDPEPAPERLPPPEPAARATPDTDTDTEGSTEEKAPPPPSLLTERPDEVDDLKRIKGVGPKMEGILNDKGVYLFHQVANFTPQDVAWVNGAIDAFPGRIQRDDWVGQAQELYAQKYAKRHDEI